MTGTEAKAQFPYRAKKNDVETGAKVNLLIWKPLMNQCRKRNGRGRR